MKKKINFIEIFILLILSVIVYWAAGQLDILEKIVAFTHQHEEWELDELIVVGLFWVFVTTLLLIRKTLVNKRIKSELQHTISELTLAAEEIKQLKGIVPICANCKNIRDDEGFWHQVEVFVAKHSDAQFTHGICPDCSQKLYPDIDLKALETKQ